MKANLWRPLAMAALLLAVLTILLVRSRSPDTALLALMEDGIGRYELYDAELTRDVLSARAGLLANYDPLATDRGNLQRALRELHDQSAAGSAAVESQLRVPIDDLETAQQQKLVAVEHFKSANALLRNSLLYLTFAGPILQIPEKPKAFAGETGHLSYAVLRFVQTPDPGVEEEINAVLARLATAAKGNPDLATLVVHGRLIVNLVPRTDGLLRAIVSAPASMHAHELQAAVLHQQAIVEQRAQVYRVLLFVVALCLLGYAIYQFVRLRLTARQLLHTNISLRHEMTERARATADLRSSEARFRAMSESAKEAIVSVSAGGKIVLWNAGAVAIFGYAGDEALDSPLFRLWPVADRANYERSMDEIPAPGNSGLNPGTQEFTGLRRDGSEVPLEVSWSAWETEEGRFITAIMRDVSERKQLQEKTRQQELQLMQKNRMADLGLLVSCVAHEIGNFNFPIRRNAPLVARVCHELRDTASALEDHLLGVRLLGVPYREMLEELPLLANDMDINSKRIQDQVDELKFFFRGQGLETPRVFQVNDAVLRAQRLLSYLIDSRTSNFRTDLSPDLPLAQGYEQHLEQVVVNLLINALDALPERGRGVSVSTSFDVARRRVVLVVEDQGVGIPEANLDHVCEPFFTTKEANGGTGLGLAITATLLAGMGGQIRFESIVSQGTRAIVDVPLAADVRADAGERAER